MIVAASDIDTFKKLLVELFGAEVQNRGKDDFLAIISGETIVIGNSMGKACQITCKDLQLLKQLEGMWSAAMSEAMKVSASTCTDKEMKNGV